MQLTPNNHQKVMASSAAKYQEKGKMASMPPMMGLSGPMNLSESPETHGREQNGRNMEKAISDGRPNLN